MTNCKKACDTLPILLQPSVKALREIFDAYKKPDKSDLVPVAWRWPSQIHFWVRLSPESRSYVSWLRGPKSAKIKTGVWKNRGFPIINRVLRSKTGVFREKFCEKLKNIKSLLYTENSENPCFSENSIWTALCGWNQPFLCTPYFLQCDIGCITCKRAQCAKILCAQSAKSCMVWSRLMWVCLKFQLPKKSLSHKKWVRWVSSSHQSLYIECCSNVFETCLTWNQFVRQVSPFVIQFIVWAIAVEVHIFFWWGGDQLPIPTRYKLSAKVGVYIPVTLKFWPWGTSTPSPPTPTYGVEWFFAQKSTPCSLHRVKV